jgi:hypothetical protein
LLDEGSAEGPPEGREVDTASVTETRGGPELSGSGKSLLEDESAELAPGEEVVREVGAASVLELAGEVKLLGGMLFLLEDGPTGPDGLAE